MSRKLFISYSHQDKSVAKQVAEALSGRGYDVFWDARIPTGMTFDTYIYRELEDSDAVIVLWSTHSVDSDYVKEEAEYAKTKRMLVPLTIDATPLPFGFARIQTTDISGWHGSTQDPRWQTVVDSIEAILGDETRRLSGESHAAADEVPRVPTVDVVPHNLPMELTSFVGRDAEIRELVQLLNEARLLTLTGVGGVGKTRLALQVAARAIDRYRDGVWLVELGALSDPDLTAKQVAVAMSVQEQANRPIAETLLEVTSTKVVLLVLDNCEHLIEGVAVLAEELLRSCPGVRLLATSREPLGVSGETLWTLQPMSVPSLDIEPAIDRLGAVESIDLFIDRARLADREFSLNEDNAAACAEICRRLDGVPLAIELAAASVSALSPHQIAERLDDRLALLIKGTRTALPRQQTLRAAIDWSYELLTPEEQRFFRRLSVFRGGFTLDAVEALWSHEEKRDRDALELLTHLVDKSLVVITSRAETRRFGLLETIRQYAWERLESAQETDAALAQHREWFTSWAKEQERLLATADQLAALQALETDYDNLRAVLERSMASGDVEPALRIAADISYFWWLHSHFGEAGAWFERLLAVGQRVPPRVRAKLLLGAGRFSHSVSDHEQATERLAEASRIAEQINAPRMKGWALAHLMMSEVARLNFDAARVHGEQSLHILQNAGDLLGIAWVTWVQAYERSFDLWMNNKLIPKVAEDLMSEFEPMVAASQQLGDRLLLGHSLELLGSIALEAGRIDDAGAHLSEAVSAFDTLGNSVHLARTLDHVALLATRANQPAAAIRLLGATTTLRERVGVSATLVEQFRFDRALDTARKNLTPNSFKDAWAEGIGMTRDQAVEHARTIMDGTASRHSAEPS
ncbi:MAG: TIR domain-containing protein [Gemmatimonadota bacterium]|nr:MAG: TIR domain-containing protein [Gemmatimonadota bacterium]